jgi:arylsulfatase A-like enzyme
VRDGRWKYHEKDLGSDELYDLQNDPFELQSLGKDPAFAGQRRAMATLLAGLRPELFACADGLDNDGNGLVDVEDPGCDAPGDHAEKPDPRCGLGFELALAWPLLTRWRRARRRC